jgi:hypothetical protein
VNRLIGFCCFRDQKNYHNLLRLLLVMLVYCSAIQIAQAREYDTFIWSAGYVEESINWSSAGSLTSATPNIGQSFEIPSIELVNIGFVIKEKNSSGVVGLLEVDYATATDGPARESRYSSDNRSNEYYQRTSETKGGRFLRSSLGFGTDFKLLAGDLLLTPLIGYAINSQRYQLENGKQIISSAPSTETLGTIDQLNSLYETKWSGGWLGVDFTVLANDQFSISGNFRYFKLDYEAEANWDKQSDFEQSKSFTHIAEGDGTGANVEFSYTFGIRSTFVLGFKFFSWKADNGTATLNNITGTQSTRLFNGVEWESESIYFGVKKYF